MTKEEVLIKKELNELVNHKKFQGSLDTMDMYMEKFMSLIRLCENYIKYSSMDEKDNGKEVAKGRRIKNMLMKNAMMLGFEVSRDQFSGEVVRIVYDPKLREQAKKRKVKHVDEK